MRFAQPGDSVRNLSTGRVAVMVGVKADGRIYLNSGDIWERWNSWVVCGNCGENSPKPGSQVCTDCDADAKHFNS